ncbi:MAG: class I SAM-dependent methyltransferase [Deltaproteobacteria bacterium]|nr:class I SAM-dependent methyltransferase [Deltaproteobacteria bacterium]
MLREAVRTLQLPFGSRGLDAGCGVGLQTLLLAEAVGPMGRVAGLDMVSDLLAHARQRVKDAGLSEQISFQKGRIENLPFSADTFDWAWSADCVGYAPMESLPLLSELARVVKPGGAVAILAWSSEKLLPGYPGLEARLGATAPGIAPFVHGKKPETHFSRALDWFHALGLEETKACVLADSVNAPLSEDHNKALVALFDMRWPGAEAELSKEDREDFKRLCKPESPVFILRQPAYYAFFTYSMFSGRIPG